jgi:hypothetical protein
MLTQRIAKNASALLLGDAITRKSPSSSARTPTPFATRYNA